MFVGLSHFHTPSRQNPSLPGLDTTPHTAGGSSERLERLERRGGAHHTAARCRWPPSSPAPRRSSSSRLRTLTPEGPSAANSMRRTWSSTCSLRTTTCAARCGCGPLRAAVHLASDDSHAPSEPIFTGPGPPLPQVDVQVTGGKKLEHLGIKIELIGNIGAPLLPPGPPAAVATAPACGAQRPWFIHTPQPVCPSPRLPCSPRARRAALRPEQPVRVHLSRTPAPHAGRASRDLSLASPDSAPASRTSLGVGPCRGRALPVPRS